MRHAGTRLCAHKLAILPTIYCGICQIPLMNFQISGGGLISTDRSYFTGRAASSEIAGVDWIPSGRDYVLTQHLLLFVTAKFVLGMYFLPVAVVLTRGLKQVTTLP